MADFGSETTARIEAKVQAFAEQRALLPDAGTLVVAVSGGADSLCLLGVLAALCQPDGPWPRVSLVVAHLDHGLRGEQATADAAWVAERAAELHLPCRIGERDVAGLAERHGRGLEDAGRRARYAFLREVATAVQARRICVGHTLDDQVETLVMRWLRGSALRGLTGMRPLTSGIARPLLALTRAETHTYCAARGWMPREDSTNQDLRFWRNRIRAEVLPVLWQENPNLTATLTRNAELLADDERYLAARAAAVAHTVILEETSTQIVLDAGALCRSAPALRRRMLRSAIGRLAHGELTVQSRHLLQVEALAATTAGERSLHLPAGLRASVSGERLVLTRLSPSAARSGTPTALRAAPPVTLPVPGCVDVPETPWRISAQILDADVDAPPPGTEKASVASAPVPLGAEAGPQPRAYLDADAVGEPLRVAIWSPGDRFRPLGMAQEKKLQDFFVDAKVPRSARARVPLVWGPRHLVWVAGHRIDDRARVTSSTRRVLALRLARRGPRPPAEVPLGEAAENA